METFILIKGLAKTLLKGNSHVCKYFVLVLNRELNNRKRELFNNCYVLGSLKQRRSKTEYPFGYFFHFFFTKKRQAYKVKKKKMAIEKPVCN